MPATTSITSVQSSIKRKIIENDESPLRATKQRRVDYASSASGGTLTVAELSTRNPQGTIDKLLIKVDRVTTIGRKPTCDYILNEPTVSSTHCIIHTVQSDTGKISVVCEDCSANGIRINGNSFHGKRSVLLMDGDLLEIWGSQTFMCRFKGRCLAQSLSSTSQGSEVIGHYEITAHKLGSGAYSSVNLAIDREAKRQVACKTIIRRTQADIDDVLKEVELLRKLRHPNINAVYGFDSSGDNLHIFLELATGGDLFSYMAKYGSLGEGESRYIAFQLMKGLQYIHRLLISHRDLKPENILLSTPGRFPRVVIADFGLAREQAYEPTANVAGTVSYLPPEAVDAITWKQKYSSESTDAWALGLIVFIMLKGFHPFDPCRSASKRSNYPCNNMGELDTPSHSEELVRRRIVQKETELIFDREEWNDLSLARSFISRLLVRDRRKRETVQGTFKHSWIQTEYASLERAYAKFVERGWSIIGS